jgi:hypothetical protein
MGDGQQKDGWRKEKRIGSIDGETQDPSQKRWKMIIEHSPRKLENSLPGGGETRGSSRRPLRKAFVFGVGSLVILAGVVMIFIPGPGVLAIFAGMAILASEFPWARQIMDRFKLKFDEARDRFKGWRTSHRDERPDSRDSGDE